MKKRKDKAKHSLKYLPFVISLSLVAMFAFFTRLPTTFAIIEAPQVNVICNEIHWHALLKIEVNGERQTIPTGIGINKGKVIDTELSGGNTSPMHTHDDRGIIHIENNCPEKNPRTTTLGYFFQVWEKQFNATCIFNHCNNEVKTLQVNVNNENNFEFGEYKIRDGDEIEIFYTRPKALVIKTTLKG